MFTVVKSSWSPPCGRKEASGACRVTGYSLVLMKYLIDVGFLLAGLTGWGQVRKYILIQAAHAAFCWAFDTLMSKISIDVCLRILYFNLIYTIQTYIFYIHRYINGNLIIEIHKGVFLCNDEKLKKNIFPLYDVLLKLNTVKSYISDIFVFNKSSTTSCKL